jgi:ubiquinone/menaquinone biosynthesis C-methylase UbiE
MYSPSDQSVQEFYKHQELLLPFTSRHIGRTNLDIGCGTGLTSVIHQEKLGIAPTLCDVVDIRNALAQSLPFFLVPDGSLPFDDNSFDSSYIQYVLHHMETSAAITRLLAEALRVSRRAIIVEEITGDRMDVARAQQFDKDVNERIHPNISMPVYRYCTPKGLLAFAVQVGASVLFHHRLSEGEAANGFLETHVFVIARSHEP